MSDPLAPLHAAYAKALAEKESERQVAGEKLRALIAEHPWLEEVAKRTLPLVDRI